MTVKSSRKKGEALTPETFAALLNRLDPNREKAGVKYEIIRRKLVRYFGWHGCPYPEEHADEAIDRVSRRAAEGEEIRDITNYFYGVARLLFKETVKNQEKQQVVLNELQRIGDSPEDGRDIKRECLETCLAKLPEETRWMILKYHQEDKRVKINTRKELAKRMNIPLNALRIRIYRLKELLEKCVEDCLKHE